MACLLVAQKPTCACAEGPADALSNLCLATRQPIAAERAATARTDASATNSHTHQAGESLPLLLLLLPLMLPAKCMRAGYC